MILLNAFVAQNRLVASPFKVIRASLDSAPTSEDAYSVHPFSSAENKGVEAEDYEGFLVASACKP